MEEKLSLNKTICKIIECVYIQDILKSVLSLEKEVLDLSPEEYLKISEIIRDEIEVGFRSDIVLQLVKGLKEDKFKEYYNFVVFNLYYYFYLYKESDYIVQKELLEDLKDLDSPNLNGRIKEALIYLIEDNLILKEKK